MAGTRLLIVHEEGAYVQRVREGLENDTYAFEVMSAISAPRAIGVATQKQPDVIMIDTDMTGVDGYALTEQMKADPALADIPVILVSEQISEAAALKARQAGAVAHLSETLSAGELYHKLMGLLGRAAEEAPAQAQAEATAAPAPDAGYGAPQPVGDTSDVPSPAARTAPTEVGAGRDGLTGERRSTDVPSIDDLLRLMIERGGSDLHVTVGSPPGIRLRGEIIAVEGQKSLTPRDAMEMILNLLSEEQRRKFETELELDFAYSIPGVSRFRANVFQQRNSMAAVFRVIPLTIPTIDDLMLPPVCRYLAERPRGLVLVTGPTGSGKSTTQAAMIDHINGLRPLHIITMEDPIEFLHQNKKAYVNQREIGEDTHSFSAALKRVLRQDPDVILVGEMPRSRRPRPATSCSRRCTPPAVRRRSIASSTCSRRTSSSRSGCSSPTPSKGSCRRSFCAPPTGRAGCWRWRSCSASRPSATSSARVRPTR